MIEQEYAKSLFELSIESNEQNEIFEQFKLLIQAFDENLDIYKVLTYPRINKGSKHDAIKKITNNFNELFVRFLYVLIDNDRIGYINTIFEEFKKLQEEKNNIVVVEVTSVNDLKEDVLENIKNNLSKKYMGKTIIIKNIKDSSLIGGIKIICNGESLDLSLLNKIGQLKASL